MAVQKGHISGWNSPHNLLKNVIFGLYFQHEGHLFANCVWFKMLDLAEKHTFQSYFPTSRLTVCQLVVLYFHIFL